MDSSFDRIIDRRRRSVSKWNFTEKVDTIPLTVADMDFVGSLEVMKGIQEDLNHGIFGYVDSDERLKKSVKHWYKAKHHVDVEEEWIVFCPRIITGVAMTLMTFLQKGDGVMIFSPWYGPLARMICHNQFERVEYPLEQSEERYYIDYEKVEKLMIKEKVKALIFTNPHNPTGRVWKKKELRKITEICERQSCLLLSDEVHSDVVFEGEGFRSLLDIGGDKSSRIVFNSPAKTFNVAGLHVSYVIIPEPEKRRLLADSLGAFGVGQPSVFGMEVLNKCYRESNAWYEEMLLYLEENRQYTLEYFRRHLQKLKVIKGEGSFLLWINVKAVTEEENMIHQLLEKSGVRLSRGSYFGERYSHFVRLNYACPRAQLKEGLDRIKRALT